MVRGAPRLREDARYRTSGDSTQYRSSSDSTHHRSSGDSTQYRSSSDSTQHRSSGESTQDSSCGDSTQDRTSGNGNTTPHQRRCKCIRRISARLWHARAICPREPTTGDARAICYSAASNCAPASNYRRPHDEMGSKSRAAVKPDCFD